MIMVVGYAEDSLADTFQIFNPKTSRIVQLRDVKWFEWETLDLKCNMIIFSKQPELLEVQVGFDNKEYVPPISTMQAPASTLIPDDYNSDAKAGGKVTSGEDTSALKPDKVVTDEGSDSE
jgi:hypothetical protein